jgi:hypothetical protein
MLSISCQSDPTQGVQKRATILIVLPGEKMSFRFQRRIRIAPGVRLNLSKSGVGGSIGRTGLRLGLDAKRRKYFSVGLPGTGLSYRTFFGQRVRLTSIKIVAYVVIAAALCLGVVVLAIR